MGICDEPRRAEALSYGPPVTADYTLPIAFLETLYADTDGHIETRFIVDRTTGEPREPGDMKGRRAWASVADLAAKLPTITAWAKQARCAVFFGVLPRKTAEGTTAADVGEGSCLWADIDWKDFDNETAGRAAFAGLEYPPSIVVRSAHGVHLYWLLSEPNEPEALSDLSRRLAAMLGADACHDAARLLRLPGSYNCKDPNDPILVEIEELHPERRYHAGDLDVWIPVLARPRIKLAGAVDLTVPAHLTEKARAILEANQQVRSHWRGEGKSKGDTSSSGYDWTTAYDILKAGGGPEDAASAVASRPDGSALAKGTRHIERTVGRAVAALEQYRADQDAQVAVRNATERVARQALKEADKDDKRAAELAAAWRPNSVAIYRTDPPRYVFTSGDRVFEVTTSHLAQRHQMRRRLMEVLLRIVQLPTTKWGAYDAWVNELLEGAKVYEQPPEASRYGGIHEELAERLGALRAGDCAADLARGCAVEVDGRRAVRLSPLLRSLRQSDTEITRPELAQHLSRAGWESRKGRLEGEQVRVWLSPRGEVVAPKGPEPVMAPEDWSAAPPTA